MADFVQVDFAPLSQLRVSSAASPKTGTRSRRAAKVAEDEEITSLLIFVGDDLNTSAATSELLGEASGLVKAASAAARFKGKASSAMEILAPNGLAFDRLVVIGLGAEKDRAGSDEVQLGGFVMSKIPRGSNATVVFDLPGEQKGKEPGSAAADLVMGMKLRAYRFDLYKTKKKDDSEKDSPANITVAVADATAARREAKSRDAIAEGVTLARTLVNEPPNVLYPAEFARRATELAKLGVAVEVLDAKAIAKLGMRALLAVGQGSEHESRVVIMRWEGAKGSKAKPVAFIGKGVCFDTGGISIKPGAGMEDMKGDMAGAACVVGLMHALAARKANVNAIGAIGLVENMPDGKAQRPGDIVKSMSGQTIEIINTDAEGRLVLADMLWHIKTKYKPECMIDLATLTGAILVALGNEYAGLFSNNDALSEKITAAGKVIGEKVWRLPMGPAYDKLIDSKFADMKNTGGRHGGSISAAQFLQRFVEGTPWAHLDIAGTGMGSPQTDINQSWGSGWGVRLLDRLIADNYERR